MRARRNQHFGKPDIARDHVAATDAAGRKQPAGFI